MTNKLKYQKAVGVWSRGKYPTQCTWFEKKKSQNITEWFLGFSFAWQVECETRFHSEVPNCGSVHNELLLSQWKKKRFLPWFTLSRAARIMEIWAAELAWVSPFISYESSHISGTDEDTKERGWYFVGMGFLEQNHLAQHFLMVRTE